MRTALQHAAHLAGKYTALGVHLQRVCMLCLLVASVSVAAWWFQAEAIMRALGQAETLIPRAAVCLRIMAPALFLRTIQVRMCDGDIGDS